jgi:hypothetical protein
VVTVPVIRAANNCTGQLPIWNFGLAAVSHLTDVPARWSVVEFCTHGTRGPHRGHARRKTPWAGRP